MQVNDEYKCDGACDCDSYYINGETQCDTQLGCSPEYYDVTHYIGIEADKSNRGVKIFPKTNSDKYCNEYGNNCVSVNSPDTRDDNGGNSGQPNDRQKVRDQSWCSCPSGYYVYKIKMANYADDHGIRPLCSCKKLPVD
mgnify:CR=1 FL=1